MIRFTSEDGNPLCLAELKDRFGVYLDNDSLIELARGSQPRRSRFVEALRRRGTLLFSLTNAVELAGPQGATANAVREFLDSVGRNWVPLELNPWTVVERERAGEVERAAVSERFMEAYFQRRAFDLSPDGEEVLDLSSETFFRLGSVLDWAQEDRVRIRADQQEMDRALRDQLNGLRADYDKDRASLDRCLPPIPFNNRYPARFVLIHLLRKAAIEANQFKDGDARDLCHAVLAVAYGSVATLDKQWKRRVESLPKPHLLAKTYYRPEVDELVALLESLVAQK